MAQLFEACTSVYRRNPCLETDSSVVQECLFFGLKFLCALVPEKAKHTCSQKNKNKHGCQLKSTETNSAECTSQMMNFV